MTESLSKSFESLFGLKVKHEIESESEIGYGTCF